jgi:hypothetical protein
MKGMMGRSGTVSLPLETVILPAPAGMGVLMVEADNKPRPAPPFQAYIGSGRREKEKDPLARVLV